MEEIVLYDSESLDLSTMKVQTMHNGINVEDLAEAFAVLNRHYGDLRTVLPRMKQKLSLLGNYPKNEEDENKNIQK